MTNVNSASPAAILFVSTHWPGPLAEFNHGVAQRMRLLLRAATKLGHPLDLLFFHSDQVKPCAAEVDTLRNELQRLWLVRVRHIHICAMLPGPEPDSHIWRSYLRPALTLALQPTYAPMAGAMQAKAVHDAIRASQPVLLMVHRLAAMLPILAQPGDLPPVAFDLDDIEHKAYRRALALPPHWGAKRLLHLWVPAIKRAEKIALRRASTTFVCSAADAAELNALYRVNSVQVVPNALSVPRCTPLPGTATVLFLGIYSYAPNRLAAEFMMDSIWPLVRVRYPDARLLIAGRFPNRLRHFNAPPAGVEILGFVDDLQALYSRTQVVVCPVQSGGGTRVKIIEAALQARPVVSTVIGAEGLDFRPQNGEITLADNRNAFADAVSELLSDPIEAHRRGEAARARALELYAEDAVIHQVTAALSALLLPDSRIAPP